MKAALEHCSLQKLYRLHASLSRGCDCLTGELQRPVHFDGPGGDYISACHVWLSDRLTDIEKEMARRPVRSYEDAAMLFTVRAGYVKESPGEHYAEVLKLLAHAQGNTCQP